MATASAQGTDFFQIWHEFIKTGSTENAPDSILSSWRRSRQAGVDYTRICSTKRLAGDTVDNKILAQADLHHLLDVHNEVIKKNHNAVPLAFLFVDSNGYIITAGGDEPTVRALEQSPVGVGSCIREDIVGTTAPGISLAEKRPALVIGEEHFARDFHWASCFSIPIFSPERELCGLLDFSCASTYGPQLKQLVSPLMNIASSLQFELFIKHKLRELSLHEAYFQSTFEYADTMLIMVDPSGRIIDINTAAQSAFHVSPGAAQFTDVRELLEFPFSLQRLSQKTTNIPTHRTKTGQPLCMTAIPIYNRQGVEKAFLLKIQENKKITASLSLPSGNAPVHFGKMVGRSKPFQRLIQRVAAAAAAPTTILLEGETGTGKELLAQAIHHASAYHHGPFVAINCSAVPNELVESELFGYERGAFTGAQRQGHSGKFEQANHGTLLLDEIHTMALSAQMKLLRVLEDRRVTRIGGTSSLKLDLRIIAATSMDLCEEVSKGNFADALFYRLNVVKLRVPSLRERREDLPCLVDWFITRMNEKYSRSIEGVTPEVEEIFRDYNWPGNIRELRNCIESAFVFCNDTWIRPDHLEGTPVLEKKLWVATGDTPLTIGALTEKVMCEALDRFGNVKDAARHLGISKSTFYRRMKNKKG